MTKSSSYMRLVHAAGAVGLIGVLAAPPLSAQNLGDMVRGLNNVINPGDAQRYEDQARQNNQPQQERYWRDYRTGLESPGRDTDNRRGSGDRGFDPSNPRSFRSDAALNLELGHLSRDEQRSYRDMTDSERRRYDDRLSDDAQRRYERMTNAERQRYLDDLDREQHRLDSTRRR